MCDLEKKNIPQGTAVAAWLCIPANANQGPSCLCMTSCVCCLPNYRASLERLVHEWEDWLEEHVSSAIPTFVPGPLKRVEAAFEERRGQPPAEKTRTQSGSPVPTR